MSGHIRFTDSTFGFNKVNKGNRKMRTNIHLHTEDNDEMAISTSDDFLNNFWIQIGDATIFMTTEKAAELSRMIDDRLKEEAGK